VLAVLGGGSAARAAVLYQPVAETDCDQYSCSTQAWAADTVSMTSASITYTYKCATYLTTFCGFTKTVGAMNIGVLERADGVLVSWFDASDGANNGACLYPLVLVDYSITWSDGHVTHISQGPLPKPIC
jgi:hypothetical protein